MTARGANKDYQVLKKALRVFSNMVHMQHPVQ